MGREAKRRSAEMSNGQTKPLSPKLPFYLISVVLLCRIRTRITTTLMMGGKMTVIMPGKKWGRADV